MADAASKTCSRCAAAIVSGGTMVVTQCPCGVATYCGVACQRAHWTTSHRLHCAFVRETAAAIPRVIALVADAQALLDAGDRDGARAVAAPSFGGLAVRAGRGGTRQGG